MEGLHHFLFDTVNIGPFSDTACVLTQTNTFNDPTPVTTRVMIGLLTEHLMSPYKNLKQK